MPRPTQVLDQSAPWFSYGTFTLCGAPFQNASHPIRSSLFVPCGCRVLQPRLTSQTIWAAPRSLATTCGIVSLPRDTWMFRFSRCPSSHLWIQSEDHAGSRHGVSPFGNSRILRLQTAPRDLSQSTTSFFGVWRLGIHPVPFVAYSRDCSRVNPFPNGSLRNRSPPYLPTTRRRFL